ncbi:MAG: hypothetical protein O3B13_07230 [Planctomycetota bacterium]|nr:hypothetical protein [Planctomycetota bacterium]MDA1162876.1 hypothetical protein [Planctomycetota bacterium]
MSLTLRQIAETAAFASARSTFLIESSRAVTEQHLHNYWKCCRGRTMDWLRKLDALLSEAGVTPPEDHSRLWRTAEPLLAEVFVTEILTRVWATTLTAADLHRRESIGGPIARNTLKSHTEARNRAMSLMVDGLHVPVSQMSRVDCLRRKAERWSDLLIGHLVLNYQLDEFAFESTRSVEFGQSQMREVIKATDEPVWEFVLAGVRLAFSSTDDVELPSDVWNRGVLRSVLGSFPADSFDGTGTFKSIRRVRIERGQPDSDRVVDALLQSSGVSNRSGLRSSLKFSELRKRPTE